MNLVIFLKSQIRHHVFPSYSSSFVAGFLTSSRKKENQYQFMRTTAPYCAALVIACETTAAASNICANS